MDDLELRKYCLGLARELVTGKEGQDPPMGLNDEDDLLSMAEKFYRFIKFGTVPLA